MIVDLHMCHVANYFNCWGEQTIVVWKVRKSVCKSKVHKAWRPVMRKKTIAIPKVSSTLIQPTS